MFVWLVDGGSGWFIFKKHGVADNADFGGAEGVVVNPDIIDESGEGVG